MNSPFEAALKGVTIPPIKKEFITVWAPEEVQAEIEAMPISRASFFHIKRSGVIQDLKAMIPEISYDDLLIFTGKKTKVTIEVIE